MATKNWRLQPLVWIQHTCFGWIFAALPRGNKSHFGGWALDSFLGRQVATKSPLGRTSTGHLYSNKQTSQEYENNGCGTDPTRLGYWSWTKLKPTWGVVVHATVGYDLQCAACWGNSGCGFLGLGTRWLLLGSLGLRGKVCGKGGGSGSRFHLEIASASNMQVLHLACLTK